MAFKMDCYMIRMDFFYFIQQLWLYVNFSPIRKKMSEKLQRLPFSFIKGAGCRPLQTLIFSSLNNACDDEMFILRYQNEQCLCPGNKAFVCLLIYLNVSGLQSQGECWLPGFWSLSAILFQLLWLQRKLLKKQVSIYRLWGIRNFKTFKV